MLPSDSDITDRELLLRLASDAPGVWEDAATRLLERGAEAAPALVRGLDDDRLGSVGRWRLLRVLGRLGRAETVPAVRAVLERALARPDASVVHGALEALSAIGTPEAVDALTALLDHPDRDVVQRAAVLAGETGDARAVGPLARLLASDDPGLRYSAAQGLLRIPDPAAREALDRRLARETDPHVRALLRAEGHE